MHQKLHDLRLLYLAHQVEEIFERLERAFERHLTDPVVKETLKPLFAGGPGHRELESALERLNAEVAAHEGDLSQADILMAILECERLAQGFYQLHVNDLYDKDFAQLFQKLGAEEGRHIQAVEQALRIAG